MFFAPLNWRFQSGDRVGVQREPYGERLTQDDEVAGVPVAAGSYHWQRYRLSRTAQKRPLLHRAHVLVRGFSTMATCSNSSGRAREIHAVDYGRVFRRAQRRHPAGRPYQTLTGTRVRLNLSPDLSFTTGYVRSRAPGTRRSIGVNSRLRWTFRPAGDLFVVYNHNVHSLLDRWELESNQFLVKVQYTFRR